MASSSLPRAGHTRYGRRQAIISTQGSLCEDGTGLGQPDPRCDCQACKHYFDTPKEHYFQRAKS